MARQEQRVDETGAAGDLPEPDQDTSAISPHSGQPSGKTGREIAPAASRRRDRLAEKPGRLSRGQACWTSRSAFYSLFADQRPQLTLQRQQPSGPQCRRARRGSAE